MAQVGIKLSGMGDPPLIFQEANEFVNTIHETPRVRGQHLLPLSLHARTLTVVTTKGAEYGVIDGPDGNVAVLKPDQKMYCIKTKTAEMRSGQAHRA